MGSKLDIWNLALAHIGDGDDVDDKDEESVEAEQCRKFYPIARDMVLEEHNWDFAVDTVELSRLSEGPVGDWTYRYAMPSDYIKAIGISPNLSSLRTSLLSAEDYERQVLNHRYRFEIQADDDDKVSVLSDESTLFLKYVFRNENTASYTPGFVMSVSRLLASFLAGGPLVKSAKAAATQYQAYLLSIGSAKTNISNGTQTRPPHYPSHLRSR